MTEKRQIIAVPSNTDLPFSTVVGFGKMIFVSGLIGRHPETGQIATDISEQTRQTLANLEGAGDWGACVQSCGGSAF